MAEIVGIGDIAPKFRGAFQTSSTSSTVEELIGNESKTMVFKSLNDLAPQYLCNLFTKNSACSSRSLRNTETDLRLPKKRSANGQKCFSFRGAKLWNSLPAESSQTSQFPDSWKVARITPIFKEGDKTEKSNYRPISVLPVISKLFEKLVFNQLYHYMKENSLFTSDQSGFLRLHSTLTCLLKMSDDWYNGLDLSKLVGLVFIDLKKAFDTVDHDILCKKLELEGCRPD